MSTQQSTAAERELERLRLENAQMREELAALKDTLWRLAQDKIALRGQVENLRYQHQL